MLRYRAGLPSKLPTFSITIPASTDVSHCGTSLALNCQRFPLPSRPLRVPSCFRVCRQITVVLPRLQWNCDDYRRFTASTVGLPILPLNTVITAGFPFPSRSLPRFLVVEYVCRQVVDAVHFRPDHYRGVSLPNKFNVLLPPFCMAVPCITQVSWYPTDSLPNYRRFPFSSRPLPRCLVTEQVYNQITDAFHYRPDHCDYRSISARVVMLRSHCRDTVALLLLPSFYRDHRRNTATTFDARHYRRFSVSLPTSTQVCRYRMRFPSSWPHFPFLSPPYRSVSYQTRFLLNYDIFLLPPRPLPRFLGTEQIHG